ncbi:MAG: biotin-dependent carboxyltransferase family protein [Cyclobacteriaceae bacterium]
MSGVEVLKILNPGVHATLQDGGRVGFREYAIPMSGCLDSYSQKLANYLVGNPAQSPVIEIIGQFKCEILNEIEMGVCGLGAKILINGEPAEADKTLFCSAKDLVEVRGKLAYMAVNGGFTGQMHFGSISTYPLARLGGLDGRLLAKGEVLIAMRKSESVIRKIPIELLPKQPEIIRVIKGPEFEGDESAFEKLSWSVTSSSNRMGLRLSGNTWNTKRKEMNSVPVFPGTIQLPSDGRPILLLSDAQTTGGYPRIAQVVKADMSRAGRLIAGGQIRFKFVTIDEAQHIFHKQESFINHAL